LDLAAVGDIGLDRPTARRVAQRLHRPLRLLETRVVDDDPRPLLREGEADGAADARAAARHEGHPVVELHGFGLLPARLEILPRIGEGVRTVKARSRMRPMAKRGRGGLKRQPPVPGARRDTPHTSRFTLLASSLSTWPNVSPLNLKIQWPHLVVVFVAVFGLYAYISLNTFFFFCLFYLALVFLATKNLRVLYVFAGVFGLSLANHWPLMLLSTPCLVLLLLPARREVLRASPRMLGIAFVACVLPYLW